MIKIAALLLLVTMSQVCAADDKVTVPDACKITWRSEECREEIHLMCIHWGIIGQVSNLEHNLRKTPPAFRYICEQFKYEVE